MSPSIRSRRGSTVMELMVGLGAMAGMTLVIAVMFRIASVSSRASAEEAEILSNARRALFGEGPLPGLASESRYAVSVTTAAGSYLCLIDSLGVSTTYTLTAGNLVRSRQGSVTAAAEGVSQLSFAYYKVTGNYVVSETNDPALARLVTSSVVFTRKNRDVTLFSGRRLHNGR